MCDDCIKLEQELERYKHMWLVCPLCKGSYQFEEGERWNQP